jgi:hypothetical protein
MTHDELLLDVSEVWNWYEDQERFAEVVPYLLALRAVVELHKPYMGNVKDRRSDYQGYCPACTPLSMNFYEAILYPCPTIQAIEKELA